MNNDLNELADVLEDEVALGETLCRNIEAQKNALVAWNMAMRKPATTDSFFIRSFLAYYEGRPKKTVALMSNDGRRSATEACCSR